MNFILPIAECQLPIADCRLSIAEVAGDFATWPGADASGSDRSRELKFAAHQSTIRNLKSQI